MFPSDIAARVSLRLPDDVKAFLAREAKRNGSSQNSEVIRALRERMERAHAAPTGAAGSKATV